MSIRLIGAACAAVLTLAVLAQTAHADAVEDFYKGRTVSAIVPFGAGGGYALYTQVLARHLPRHIPGHPTIVPQYMPGAGGIKATNYVFNVAPKDGSVLAMVSDAVVLASVIEADTIKYRVNEFIWIGAMERVNNVLLVRGDTGVKTVADLNSKEIVLGASGRGSPTFLLPSMLRWMSGAKVKTVQGYDGINKMFHAMEQGELTGSTISWTVFKSLKGDWIRSGFAVPVVQFGVRREPDLPDVPLAIELARTPEQKAVARFMASNADVGRSFVLPPNVPADRVAALRAAFDKMVKDPGFLTDAQKQGFAPSSAGGEEVQKAVAESSRIDPKLAEIVRTSIYGEK